jgi:DNA-binding Lrp family transcriptional regulator
VLGDAAERVELDAIDRQLIGLLRTDGRISNRSMAAVVGLKEAAVATRLRSLTERRIMAVSTLIDWNQAGFHWDLWLYIDVDRRVVTDVAEEIAALENVVWVHVVFGGADIVAHVLLTERNAVAEFLSDTLTEIVGVSRVRSLVTLNTLKFDVQFAVLPLRATLPMLPSPPVDIDDLDEQILLAFMQDGRRSIRQVSRDLEVSDSTLRIRLARLEEAGLIKMCAQVDPVRTRMLRAWAYVGVSIVGVDKQQACLNLAKIPEILVVAQTTGEYDALVLAAAGRRRTLLDVVATRMRRIPGVHRTDTCDIAEVIKLDYRWACLTAQSGSGLTAPPVGPVNARSRTTQHQPPTPRATQQRAGHPRSRPASGSAAGRGRAE